MSSICITFCHWAVLTYPPCLTGPQCRLCSAQDLDTNNIPTYKKSIMALSDGGKLYRTDLALILCAEDN